MAETRVYAFVSSGSFADMRMSETCPGADAVMEKADILEKDEDRKTWDDWFESKGVGDDFMTDRDQPEHQEREEF